MYPTTQVYVTVPYGYPGNLWAAGYHTGTDFRASVGTPLHCAKGGVVEHVGWGGFGSAYGYHVIIRVPYYLSSRKVLYAHMTSSPLRPGQRVDTGDYIGRSGATGHVYGAHLHYEERISPYGYWNHRAPVFLKYNPLLKKPVVSLRKVKPGKRNRHVKRVQRHLNRRLGGNNLPITGYYGSMTRKMYREWQEKLGYRGKDADGIAGKNSLRKLGFRVIP